jgi:two-component system sensor histidine kinase/response regulator
VTTESLQPIQPPSDLARIVLECSVDGLLVIDSDGFVLFANPAAIALFAGRTAELAGFHLGAPAIHESVEIILPGGDGARYVEMRSTEIVWGGHTASLASLRDITDRKRAEKALESSEQRYRSTLEAAPDAVVVFNANRQIVLVNTQAERMFGHPRVALLQGNIDLLFPERFRQGLSGLSARYAADPSHEAPEKVGTPAELFGLRGDGAEFPIEMGVSRLETDDGELILAAIRDVTERKKMEQRSRQLEIMAAEAETANKAKSMFLSTMSHEIRTPMNAILGYSQLMARDPNLPPEAKSYLQIINRSGEHLLGIINDVLDMAKIEAGRSQITARKFAVLGLLRDLDAMFRLRAQAKGVQFEWLLSGEPVEYILADEGKIRQILINLLGNAVKFTERGRISLRVSLTYRAGGQIWLSAQVEDSGIGIAIEEQRELFQPFVQGEAGQRGRHGGTGLGLAISKGAAHLMGGDVTVRSSPGQGSVFSLEIPVERSTAPDFRGDSGERRRVLGIQGGQDAPRILIADDVADNRDWLSALLEGLGFSVRSAENGESAVSLWRLFNPQLILMDVHMPGMDGIEACRLIRSSAGGKDTVIIILSADVTSDRRSLVFENEVNDFIAKPCSESELLEKIGAHLCLSYTYEENTPSEKAEPGAADPVGFDPKLLRKLPADLISQLRDATLNGDKALLDKLILGISKSGDPLSARGLQELADTYQYDKLIDLLASH